MRRPAPRSPPPRPGPRACDGSDGPRSSVARPAHVAGVQWLQAAIEAFDLHVPTKRARCVVVLSGAVLRRGLSRRSPRPAAAWRAGRVDVAGDGAENTGARGGPCIARPPRRHPGQRLAAVLGDRPQAAGARARLIPGTQQFRTPTSFVATSSQVVPPAGAGGPTAADPEDVPEPLANATAGAASAAAANRDVLTVDEVGRLGLSRVWPGGSFTDGGCEACPARVSAGHGTYADIP